MKQKLWHLSIITQKATWQMKEQYRKWRHELEKRDMSIPVGRFKTKFDKTRITRARTAIPLTRLILT